MDYIHDMSPSEFNSIVTPTSYILAVVGSRDYNDSSYIYETLDTLFSYLTEQGIIKCLTDVIIISGKARGVDTIARNYAIDHNMLDINILPDWDTYKKIAGFKRNYNIIRHANRVLAFRYDMSNGTADSIKHAKNLNIPSHVINIPRQ